MSGMGTLFASTSTPLLSADWTPSTTGQYTGTCVFITILAGISRVLLSYRLRQEHRWRHDDLKRRPVIVYGKNEDTDGRKLDPGNKIRRKTWRLSTDVPRASLNVVIAGVGYLLSVAPLPMCSGQALCLDHMESTLPLSAAIPLDWVHFHMLDSGTRVLVLYDRAIATQ